MQTGNDPALDLTGLSLRTSPTTLDAYISVDQLNHFTQFVVWNRFDFVASFMANGKLVTLDGSPDIATTAKVGGADAPGLKPATVFDYAHNEVRISVDRAGLTAAVGSLAGTSLSGLKVTTSVTSLLDLLSSAVDSMSGPTTYAFGDNVCFIPPPARLAVSAASSGQYTDRLAVTATLLDAAGKPVNGETLRASLSDGTSDDGFTDPAGVAHFSLPLRTVGSGSLTVRWIGDNEVGPATTTAPVTVAAERTKLTATAGRGTVKATLLDDDGHGVGGAAILFTVGTKNFTLTTGSSGETVFKVNPGTLVKVSYAGRAPYFLAAASASARAGS